MGLASFNVLESRWHLLTEIVLVVLLLAAALVWPKSKAEAPSAEPKAQSLPSLVALGSKRS